MVDRTVTFTDVEDAAILAAAGEGNEGAYIQAAADSQVRELRIDQLNAWWGSLGLDGKQALYDANQGA